MAEQLAFDLPVKPSLARGDFFVSEANEMAVARLEAGGWPNGKLMLIGPEGSGKTHLAHVWAEASGAAVVEAAGVSQLDIGGVAGAMVVDNADAVEDETALFHLHNHLADQGFDLLLTGRTPPARWSTVLPDLRSRLEATDIVRITPPDDSLLAAVLMKLFADRQTVATPSAINWLTRHIDRSFAEAQRAVALVDAAALAQGRAVTRDLVAEVLDNS